VKTEDPALYYCSENVDCLYSVDLLVTFYKEKLMNIPQEFFIFIENPI